MKPTSKKSVRPLDFFEIYSFKNFTLAGLFLLIGFTATAWSDASSSQKPPHPNSQELCPGLTIHGESLPTFTNIEMQLICGQGKKEDATDLAWEDIPFQQARYNLINFLQDRGYHHPTFGRQGSGHWVDTGQRTFVTSFGLVDAPALEEKIYLQKKRKIIGSPLTPSLLESLEKNVYEKLQTIGYACPEVTSTADPDTGVVRLFVKVNQTQSIVAVTEEPIEGLMPGILRRYDAFGLNEPFNGDFLNITRNRINSQGIVENNHFSTKCVKDEVSLHHMIVPGTPRLFTVGAGIDTEGIIRTKIGWRNARIGRMGSLSDNILSANARTQILQSNFSWYFLPEVSRKYISSTVQIKHENFQHYEILQTMGQVGFATTYDLLYSSGGWFIGPSIDVTRNLQGGGATVSKFLFLENRIGMRSNDFEYYSSNPKSGYNVNLVTDFTHPGMGSDAPVQKFSLTGSFLLNVNNYDPPLFIFAIRGGLSTLITPPSTVNNNLLPDNYYQYLGGSMNIRGFGLQELRGNGNALSSAFVGIEGRLVDTLPYGIEPFIFIDIGALGRNYLALDYPVYRSPGLGIRWGSPIGVLRTTVAQGYGEKEKEHVQFYINLGQEF